MSILDLTKQTTPIEHLQQFVGQSVCLRGWVANKREGKGIAFIILRDGTGYCQCVVSTDNVSEEILQAAQSTSLESSVEIAGLVLADEKQIGGVEIQVSNLIVVGNSENYPIAKKELFETDFYGEPAYLSQSGQLYGEAMAMAMGKIYTFGPTFRAEKSKTRRHLSEFWMIEPEMAFYDIFKNMDCIEAFLQSVIQKVLTNCKHELETIGRDTSVLESSLKSFPRMTYDQAVRIIKGEENVNGVNSITSLEEELKQTEEKLDVINAEIQDREAKIATPRLKKGEINFHQTKIIQLKQDKADIEEELRNIPQWIASAKNFEYGNDFGGSDETVLTRLFDSPVMVYDWPHEVKAFYLKRNPEDARFARGVDVLAPEGYGEIVGGGERETDVNLLTQKIHEHQLPMEAFEWYLDLRRFGSVPHAGFGLGLERLVTWICKLKHVRESIPFPRMYGRLTP